MKPKKITSIKYFVTYVYTKLTYAYNIIYSKLSCFNKGRHAFIIELEHIILFEMDATQSRTYR